MADNTKQHHEPLVGIAIVTWNNNDIISTCLESVQKQTYKHIKTVVLDNNSSDTTVDVVSKNYPWVVLIESPENTGFSKGNNQIIEGFIKDTAVKYIVLLNSDACLAPDWIETLVLFANQNPHTAFLQGATLDYYDHKFLDSTHTYINQNGQAIQSGHRQLAENAPKQPLKVFGTNAAACMITREYLENQPFDYLFDEDFFMYLEDVDAVARAFVSGWNNYCVPSAIAYHMGSASSGKNPGFSVYMVNRNRWAMLVKNMPLSILLRIIPRMLHADIIEIRNIAKAKNYHIIRKFLQGRLKGVLITYRYIGKRRVISKYRKLKPKNIWSGMESGILK